VWLLKILLVDSTQLISDDSIVRVQQHTKLKFPTIVISIAYLELLDFDGLTTVGVVHSLQTRKFFVVLRAA